MGLLIRSQDKLTLVKQYAFLSIEKKEEKIHYTKIIDLTGINIYAYIDKDTQILLGKYETISRAKEILDDIQEKSQTKFLLHSEVPICKKDLEFSKRYFEDINNINTIVSNPPFILEPINKDIYIYEMPEE